MEDGWYIVHTTGDIIINHRAVAGPTRIRSGDVVRMSERGPDFSFSIVSSTAFQRAKSTAEAIKLPTAAGPIKDSHPAPLCRLTRLRQQIAIGPIASVHAVLRQPISAGQEGSTLYPAAISDSGPPPISAATQSSTSVVLASVKQNTIVAVTKEHWILWVAGGLIICALVSGFAICVALGTLL